MRFWPVLILVLLVACAAQAPPTPAAVIGVQTVQDQHNRVPLVEGKVTLFLTADGQPVTVWQAGVQLPNPVPAQLAQGRVEAHTHSGETHAFTFQAAAPLRIQLLPVALGNQPAPTVSTSDLAELEQAVTQLLPFNSVRFTILPERALPASAASNLWPTVLNLAERHATRQTITIAIIPAILGQEFSGHARVGRGVAALMLRHNGATSLATSTFVHELAHALGARHAPCGLATNPDPAFPTPDGRVPNTDVMFDSATGQVITGPRFDLMTYCQPSHISSFTTLKVLRR